MISSNLKQFSETEASGIVENLYGFEALADALPGDRDENFRITTKRGQAYILKIAHREQERAVIEMQCEALSYIASRGETIGLAEICPNAQGHSIGETTARDGSRRLVWMLGFLPGKTLATVRPHSPSLLNGLGRLMGDVDAALEGFSHPAAERDFKWDPARAAWVRDYLDEFASPQRDLVELCLDLFESEALPLLPALRRSVIHGDANDYNVLVSGRPNGTGHDFSLIDFGDMLRTCTICELAIGSAYALLGKDDPLAVASHVVAGFNSVLPLQERELAALFPLIGARLTISVTLSALRKKLEPDDPYLTISEKPAWRALERLSKIHPRLAHYTFRQACGLPPVPQAPKVVEWLDANASRLAPVLEWDPSIEPCAVLDLSVGSPFLGADPARLETKRLTDLVCGEIRARDCRVGIGLYDEARPIYTAAAFVPGKHPSHEARTVHLGLDLFVEAGISIFAPLDGRVVVQADCNAPQDFGPLIVLQHSTSEGLEFYTLYGHLSPDSLTGPLGRRVSKGDRIGAIGAPPRNGGWPPHLHFQLITDLLELGREFPGVSFHSQRGVWRALSPDPNLVLRIPERRFPERPPNRSRTLDQRRRLIGPSLSLFYREPLKIVRGWMQFLYDETGRAYLDAYNNVPHVGHCHPRVVKAVQEQAALLNTHTRYLHDNLTEYARRLAELMPDPLEVCFFLNSASEANELALRLSRAHTGREDVIVLEGAYHGHTSTLIDISPYKFGGPGGSGAKPWVHVAPLPDDYRGPFRRDDPYSGRKYARQVVRIMERIGESGRKVSAFIAETMPGVGGQIVLPTGYLEDVYQAVRAEGGVCIADEVQVGFGRLGTHFWGFQTQDVVPDIVVLGKPIGNGHPLAAVVTSRQVARSFDNGMEFFSTFGGNPVACAAGLAVLDVLQEEGLRENALTVGGRLEAGLREAMSRHPVIGDVRGCGFFLGIELVRDPDTLEPAAKQASYLVNRLRERGILTGTEGLLDNVVKIRPPMVFNSGDADFFLETLDDILHEDAMSPTDF